MVKGFLVGIVVGVLLVFAGVFFYFATGRAPVATKDPEMPMEHHLAHMALDAYINKKPHANPPVPADENTYLAGAKVYTEHCAICHGVPNPGPLSLTACSRNHHNFFTVPVSLTTKLTKRIGRSMAASV
jgi:hypothetical protein